MNPREGNVGQKRETAPQLSLLEPGVVENLVRDERLPSFMTVLEGTGAHQQERVWCLVPPVGTRFGDTVQRGPDSAVQEFISPERKSRGFADIYRFTPDEATVLQTRAGNALETLASERSS